MSRWHYWCREFPAHIETVLFPDMAGVALSRNAFVWKPDLDTRQDGQACFWPWYTSVNRVEDDYPRIVALDQPLVRPVSGSDDIRKYSQHNVDLLDIRENQLKVIPFIISLQKN